MADASLEQLKQKYQSVLNKMNQLGVKLENLHEQDHKLVLRGRAKTKADSNQVWDQIKLVDPHFTDLLAELTYEAETAAAAAAPAAKPAATAAPAAAAAAAAVKTYTVQKGDTLSAIASRVYGKSSEYTKIFEANRDQLSDPDKIRPGQVLKLPA